ncbi:MAG: hypothetical protein ACTTKU_06265 [Eggerthia catenaformis]|mgnify:FL=1|uniref:hypothetical protein n=1 Tax=Eggerthia catenaformis TaxID=31973 RepID=UPI00248D4408|nr:hypothetical protein [Eggerthia catenaformis]
MKKIYLYKLYDKKKSKVNYHIWSISRDGIVIKTVKKFYLRKEVLAEYYQIMSIEIVNLEKEYVIRLKLSSKKINDEIIISKDDEKEYFKESIKYIKSKGVNIKMTNFDDDYFYKDFNI